MSNIHNNSVLQNASARSSIKASEAQNESNGMGGSGYFAVDTEEYEEVEEKQEDRTEYLFDALVGLAAMNAPRLIINKVLTKKVTSKNAVTSFAKIA